MPDEMWRSIPASRLLGIPAGYEASSDGNVRSRRRVLAQRPDKDGYPVAKVGGKPVRVAILVQLAFAGPPQVLHLDDDRSNSRPGNLAWGSKVVNEQAKRKRAPGETGQPPRGQGEAKDEQGLERLKGTGEKGEEKKRGRGCHPPFPSVTPVTGKQG